MKNAILKVLKYFSFFDYAPTFEEIYTFLPKKTTKKELKKELELLINKKIIKNLKLKIENSLRYTVGEYGIENIKYQKSNIKKTYQISKRKQTSKRKLENWRFRLYTRLLSLFPQIKLVGLSGSLAMMNAGENDDIDLFIITAKNRLFTGRFIAVVLAWILGIRRNRIKENARHRVFSSASPPLGGGSPKRLTQKQVSLLFRNKVCLNLFFDESNLEVPSFKKTEFVAHEVLQMKPIINKFQTYERFLYDNRWVLSFFPNAVGLISKIKYQKSKRHIKYQKYFLFLIWIFDILYLVFNISQNLLEKILKKFQLYFINRHKTKEIITDSQLWFHPDDFEKKIKLP